MLGDIYWSYPLPGHLICFSLTMAATSCPGSKGEDNGYSANETKQSVARSPARRGGLARPVSAATRTCRRAYHRSHRDAVAAGRGQRGAGPGGGYENRRPTYIAFRFGTDPFAGTDGSALPTSLVPTRTVGSRPLDRTPRQALPVGARALAVGALTDHGWKIKGAAYAAPFSFKFAGPYPMIHGEIALPSSPMMFTCRTVRQLLRQPEQSVLADSRVVALQYRF